MAPRTAGFALVELLASLVILGMIGLLLVQGLGTGRRVWERLDTDTAAGEGVESAQGVLRGLIEQAFPVTRYDAGSPYSDFDGQSGALKFLAQPLASGRPAALRRYSLSVDVGGRLQLSSISDVAADSVRPTSLVLLRGVQQMDVAYYGAAAPDHRPMWRPRWQTQPKFPELVRVRVSFMPGDRRQWPDLVVRPQVTADSDCVLDRAAGGCRGRS
jgi:general secretion pathway protein J